MKASEITTDHIADYLRLEEGTYTETELQAYLDVAKNFIESYTGLDELQIDTHEDFVIVVYILCEDMYDNRSMYVDKNNLCTQLIYCR